MQGNARNLSETVSSLATIRSWKSFGNEPISVAQAFKGVDGATDLRLMKQFSWVLWRQQKFFITGTEELMSRNDFWKWLPVLYMWGTILFLYLTYVFQHCIPRMQLEVGPDLVNSSVRARGQWETVVVNCITAMLVLCYARVMCTSPGTIPKDRNWDYQTEDLLSYLPAFPSFIKEKKRSGDRRYCKWCSKYKPDRTHHCRTCKRCILKMDHHCPWMYNCVGFFNYKYFYLLLLYSLLTLLFIIVTMAETVERVIDIPTPFLTRCILFFAETLAVVLAFIVSLGFGYHTYLLTNAMSNIEFWEQNDPNSDVEHKVTPGLYNLGFYRNIKASLGDQILLWFLPLNPPSGDGIYFSSSEEGYQNRPYEDLEVTKTIRKDKGSTRRMENEICGKLHQENEIC